MTAPYLAGDITMLSRPGDRDYFKALIAATPPGPTWDEIMDEDGIPRLEPLDDWSAEAQWSDLVGRPDPRSMPVNIVRAVYTHRLTTIEALGTSGWRTTHPLATMTFRDVVIARDPHADVTVATGDIHLLRTTTTMSLTGRNALTKAVQQRAAGVGDPEQWAAAIDEAFEAVMSAAESVTDGVDLREGDVLDAGPEWVADPLWATGASAIVMPGEAGKSTLARAMAVSIVSGRLIIPGLYPRTTGPVLYIASEDPGEQTHKRSVDAICAGAGISRRALGHEIRLVPSRGQPLHRLARGIAERAREYAGVILDAQQGLLPTGDSGVRDGAATFWNAVDEIGVPVFVIAHPNLGQSRNWDQADGRAAGAEVHRDRMRLSWMGSSKPEPSVEGTYHSLFTLRCTKRNDGPRPPNWAFRRTWSPGMLTFSPAEPQCAPAAITDERRAVLDAIAGGATTDRQIASVLGISIAAARKRRQRLDSQQ